MKTTDTIALRVCLPFSWWRTRDAETQMTLIKPEKNGVPAYAAALCREIESLGRDMQEYRVDTLWFDGGYMGLFMPEQLEAILAAAHRSFHLTEDVQISGTVFPGSLDLAMISCYRNHRIGPLMFEMPSLMMRECEQLHLPNALQALDHSLYVMQSFQESDYGLQIAMGIPGRDAGVWRHIVSEALRCSPAHIAFFSLNPEMDEGEGFQLAQTLLHKAGYRQIAPRLLTRAQQEPRYAQVLRGEKPAASVGLGAVSDVDGFVTRNTQNMKTYLQQSADYRNLLVSVALRFRTRGADKKRVRHVLKGATDLCAKNVSGGRNPQKKH